MNRRTFIQHGTGAMLSTLISLKHSGFRIGACDWSLQRSCDPQAFHIAKQIGLEGIMVNMGSLADDLKLRQRATQLEFMDASKATGVKISSLAIGELNQVPFKSDPRTEQWVSDSIDVAKTLGVPVILLAFFVKNDLRNDEAGIQETILKLKRLCPKAEKAGVVLGLETYLDARGHQRIIDAVGSPNLKVYYDFRNTADAGHDTIREFNMLAPDQICELHMKENAFLLGQGSLPWADIAKAIDKKKFTGDGWMQIEWSMPDGADLIKSYEKNYAFLRNLFPV